MEIADTCGTGSTWVTLFEDKAQPLLGVSGEELANLQETDVVIFQ
jgi:hypothetical protein